MLLRELSTGIKAYGEAIVFIFSKKLAWFFLFPVLISIVLFLGGIELVDSLAGAAETWLVNKLGIANDGTFVAKYTGDLISVLIWMGLKILFFFVFAYLSGYMLLVLMSPIYSIIAARVEEIVTNKKSAFSLKQLIKEMIRGFIIAFRNMMFELSIIIVLFFVGFIPIVGWITVLLLFIVSSYFYGFSFIDYTLESKRLSIKGSLGFARRHKGLLIANGSIFAFVLLIPVVGSYLASFVGIIAVVAATISVNHPSVEFPEITSPNEQ